MFRGGEEREKIIRKCVAAFPYMWFYVSAAACLSHLLPADPGSVSACQGVSAHSSWILATDLSCFPGCEYHSFQVIHPICCLLTSLWFYLDLLECEYCLLFVLLAAH